MSSAKHFPQLGNLHAGSAKFDGFMEQALHVGFDGHFLGLMTSALMLFHEQHCNSGSVTANAPQ